VLGVTFFGIFLTPVFFYVIQWFGRHEIPSSSGGGQSRERRAGS